MPKKIKNEDRNSEEKRKIEKRTSNSNVMPTDLENVPMEEGSSETDAIMFDPQFSHSTPSYEENNIEEKVEETDIEEKDEETDNKERNGEELPDYLEPANDSKKKSVKINTRALSKEADTYQLESFKKNALIIFNNEFFESSPRRHGTDYDVGALCETFSNFGFEITSHNDLGKVNMFKELKKFSKKDFTDYGCVVVAILTHGEENGLLRTTDSQLYSEKDVINQFKNRNQPTLVTKPVIILIQACRGDTTTEAVHTHKMWPAQKDHNEELKPYHIPLEADLLVIHSSFHGKTSYRRPFSGSWFIQTLCNQINELHLTHDFESIVTIVKREVAIDNYELFDLESTKNGKKTQENFISKQIPVITSSLIRKLYLKKYEDLRMNKEYALCLPRIKKKKIESSGDCAPNSDVPETDLCSCLFEHLNYMKRCLSNFISENPTRSKKAEDLINIADKVKNDTETAESTLIAMNNYLEEECSDKKCSKYIYFYKKTEKCDLNRISKDDSRNSGAGGTKISTILVFLQLQLVIIVLLIFLI